jgi:hypothetical protein
MPNQMSRMPCCPYTLSRYCSALAHSSDFSGSSALSILSHLESWGRAGSSTLDAWSKRCIRKAFCDARGDFAGVFRTFKAGDLGDESGSTEYLRRAALMWEQWKAGRHAVGNSSALTMDRRALNADGLARSLSNAAGMKDTQRGAIVQAIGDGRAKHGQAS